MSIFSTVESGTSFHRSRFTKSISNRMDYDCQFHQLIPVLKRFVLPGDIWKIGGDVLVRFHPMLSPTLTPNNFRVRYFFVPLRLVEPNTELIITGSKDGHLYTSGPIPVFDNFVASADKNVNPNAYKVLVHSLWDYMNVPVGDYENIKTNECLPARYWQKGYDRIIWDYYDDENKGYLHETYADFDDYQTAAAANGACLYPYTSSLSKDYFTSCLPFQLKAVSAPSISFGSASISFSDSMSDPNKTASWTSKGLLGLDDSGITAGSTLNTNGMLTTDDKQYDLLTYLNKAKITITGSMNTADMRTMVAQTRIFERLARCGSRYTEYLKATFGYSPADDTLQRAQYLGGWKVPIVTTEVLQTAADGSNPVGTMRGHGITRGGQRIHTFFAKEFGMIFGLAEVRPDIQYTQGIPRQLTYKRRFDFFNPSFQHLSEQEVRNGELYVSFSDGLNDDTFGFQAYGNELRTYQNETVGQLRGNLSYWNQAIQFANRPNLDYGFLDGNNHQASFNRPFVVNGANAYPIIVQFYNRLDVYRPMVRYSTPGLVDHL